jgi:CRISPR-associated endonuclease/helicase Cas3
MSVDISEFASFFEDVYGYEPFPWQSRLARRVFESGWPACIDLPTASGKTSAIDIAVFVLACQADRPTPQRTVGRRIFFAVNRRVIVDEACERATKLAKTLLDAQEGTVKRVADVLKGMNGSESGPPLDVAELRGGIYRDRRWARAITQPIVVATTADQLGSRMLFRGYGVSPLIAPIHAALTACDSLILLDEAHVTRAFAQTLAAVARYRWHDKASPPMHFVQMTATPAGEIPSDQRFSLDETDLANPTLFKRQNASKPAELINLGKAKAEKAVDTLADLAVKSLSESRTAIAVIVNRVQTSRDVHAALHKRLSGKQIDADVHLVIGRMRPVDRDGLTLALRAIVGPERPERLPKPCFVVATQCLEVGADYDFDALVTECASLDALRQRFGRLNRNGRPIEVFAAVVTSDLALKDDDPVYGSALKDTWEWLTKNGRKSVDFGILAFRPLWDAITEKSRARLFSPAPNAAVLLPAHLDALCQTAPQAVPSPDVSYFIHGPQRDNAEVEVCWRADLGTADSNWAEIVSMLPPSSPECMTVPIRALRRWMDGSNAPTVDADVAVRNDEEQPGADPVRRVLIWCGNDSERSRPASKPSDVRPGDTVVIPVAERGWEQLGHIPGAPADNRPVAPEELAAWARACTDVDVAESTVQTTRRQLIFRVHPAFGRDALLKTLRDESIPTGDRNDFMRGDLSIPPGFSLKRSELAYPDGAGVVLRFKQLLQSVNLLQLPTEPDEDNDSLSNAGQPVSLAAHTNHVVDALNRSLTHLQMTPFEGCQRLAAELHDLGKADLRFQAMLLGSTPDEAAIRPTLLGKSGQRDISISERRRQRERAKVPRQFRHEMLSVQIVEHARQTLVPTGVDIDTLLHLIAAHHGHARPFAPFVLDADADSDSLDLAVNGLSITAPARRGFTPSHRIDSAIADRFWALTRRHGWWGLAYLESVLRLADQQASEAEQDEKERQ